MKPNRPNEPQKTFRRQELPETMINSLMEFIRTKFYAGDNVNFAKQRNDLFDWVIRPLAKYLNGRGVTLPVDRYYQIMMDNVLMPAIQFGNTTKLDYVPGWLRTVLQNHLKKHGEEYYEEGKAIRERVGFVVALAGRAVGQPALDPIRQLALAQRLRKAPKAPRKAPVKEQLTFL